MFDFNSPFFLILLATIPFLIFIQLRTKVIASKWRKRTIFLLRSIALLCAILALANLQHTHKEQRLAVAFLIDISDSVEPSQHEDIITQINNTIAKLKPTDQFSVISFAQTPYTLIKMTPTLEKPTLSTLLTDIEIEKDATDILTSLKRTLESLPENFERRIVLFSDGIHNRDNFTVNNYLPLFSASNVEIMTIPLDTIKDSIRVEELQLPNQVRKGQTFQIHAIVESDGSTPKVAATLYHNDVPIYDSEFPLQKGRNTLELPSQKVTGTHPHTYHFKLNVSDEILENNHAFGVVQIQDKPNILYVEADLEKTENMKVVLEENGSVVNVIPANEIPTELRELQFYDTVILSNISADTLTSEQMDILKNYVHDLGHGLVVIGGDKAFGPGGYKDTTLERILPVDMTPRERKTPVAIVFVIDTSGSMANYVGMQKKIDLAIEAIRAGIRNLEDEDKAGVISFSAGKEPYVISKLTSDHQNIIEVVGRLKPTGGTTAMKQAIVTAVQILKTSGEVHKHIILLSDGKSAGKHSEFIQVAIDGAHEKIITSTIAIGEAVDEELLRNIAVAGNGQSKYVQNVQELPKVLVDTVRETQNYIVQEQFQPILEDSTSPILDGINTFPILYGYVATSEKPTSQVLIKSHKNDPILVSWNYGLGKSIAWTSDIKPAWSKDWISWEKFGKFWGQVVNSILPPESLDIDFDLNVTPRSGRAKVVINTQNTQPASYVVHVAGPNGTSQFVNMQRENVMQYIGEFLMNGSGSYIITAKREADERKLTTTLSIAYPTEYADFNLNTSLLKKLSEDTDGIYQPTVEQITSSSGVPIEKRVSISHILLIIAVVLFILEMIFRKFTVASGYFNEIRSQLRGQPKATAPEIFTKLTQKKAHVNNDVYTSVQVDLSHESATKDITSETISPQSKAGTMTRLLAAKKRTQST